MRLVVAVSLVAVAAPVLAAEQQNEEEFNLGLSAGATLSDNTGRTAIDRDTETSIDAGLSAALRHERQRLSTRISADLRYSSYSYGAYGDQLQGELDAGLAWRLTRWLTLSASDNFGQSLIDARDTERPDNTQNLNVLSAGPDMAMPLGRRNELLLQGRWSGVTYEESDLDNQRLSATAGIRRRISERSEVSLNGSAESVNYESLPPANDFDIRSVFVAWTAAGARTTLGLRAGGTKVESDQYTSRSPLFALDLTRRLNTRTTLALATGRSFGSAESALLRDQQLAGVSVDARPGIASSGALRADYLTLSWRKAGSRSTLRLSADLRRNRHKDDATLNRNSVESELSVSRDLRPRLNLEASASYYVEDFVGSSFESEEWSTQLRLIWRPTFRVSIDSGWSHTVGEGDTTLGPDSRKFVENLYSLRFIWSPVQ